MNLYELNCGLLEAVRRDLYGQLNRKTLLINNTEITITLAEHLHDERENGEARGDHILPKELLSVIRVGLKKLLSDEKIENFSTNSSDRSTDGILGITFKMKAKKRFTSRNGSIKKDMFSTVITKIYKYRGKYFCKIITLYAPSPKRKGTLKKVKAQVDI